VVFVSPGKNHKTAKKLLCSGGKLTENGCSFFDKMLSVDMAFLACGTLFRFHFKAQSITEFALILAIYIQDIACKQAYTEHFFFAYGDVFSNKIYNFTISSALF